MLCILVWNSSYWNSLHALYSWERRDRRWRKEHDFASICCFWCWPPHRHQIYRIATWSLWQGIYFNFAFPILSDPFVTVEGLDPRRPIHQSSPQSGFPSYDYLGFSKLLNIVDNCLTTTSSSESSTNVTRSWQNNSETTSSTSDWTNTTAAAADKSTSFEDDNATAAMLTTSAPSVTSFWQYQACLSWFRIGSPILIVLATVGNTLSLITLQNPTLHHAFHI